MRKTLLMAAILFGSLAVKAQDKKPEDVIKVNIEKYDFGKIKQGVPVSTFFEITNISDKPVVIENAWGSCGCTTPEVPKEPIAPGATTKLKVNYNAAAMNHFDKDVFIKIAGISQTKNVKITGDVLEATAYDAQAAEIKKEQDAKAKAEADAAAAKVKETKTKVKSAGKKTKTKTVKA
jgi:hypothetical protein